MVLLYELMTLMDTTIVLYNYVEPENYTITSVQLVSYIMKKKVHPVK